MLPIGDDEVHEVLLGAPYNACVAAFYADVGSTQERSDASSPSRRAISIKGLGDSSKGSISVGAVYGRFGAPMATRFSLTPTPNSENDKLLSSSGMRWA